MSALIITILINPGNGKTKFKARKLQPLAFSMKIEYQALNLLATVCSFANSSRDGCSLLSIRENGDRQLKLVEDLDLMQVMFCLLRSSNK
jgi:hypothetical protein